MRVLIFLPVASITKVTFILDSDVGRVGVGHVERNIVASTMIRARDSNYRQQKTTMTPFVVEKKKDLSKINTVGVDVQVTVLNDGKRF
jgi:hypothetical protein